jgi:tetratricopeptide (TPR) repeat protein
MVVFQGQIVSGFALDQVKRNLQQCFKLSPDQVEKLFSGRNITLKRHLSHDQALLYQQKLLACGAGCSIHQMPEESGDELGAGARPAPAPVNAGGPPDQGGREQPAGQAPSAATITPPAEAPPSYPLYAPLYLAFFSGNFYKGIAQQWRVGRAFLYLLLLVVVTQLPLIAYGQFRLNRFITEYADLIPQIPSFRLKDQTLTKEGAEPCVLKHAGVDTVIVDAGGTRESLAASDAKVLLNSSAVLIKGKNGRIEDHRIPASLDLQIDRQFVEKWLPKAHWLWLPLILVLLPATYLFFCLKALFYGWLGTFMAKRHLAQPSFEKVLILTIICLTPVAMLDTALSPFLVSTPLVPAMVITLFILNLAIRQHGRGEREGVSPGRLPERPTSGSGGHGQPASLGRPAPQGTLKFYYGKNFTYLMFGVTGLGALPFLAMLVVVGDHQKLLLMGTVSTIAILTMAMIITLISKKVSVATLDETALSLTQITIPWSQIHSIQEKTTNLAGFRWRTLILTGSFKIPFRGNRLELPLALLDRPDELVQAIGQRVAKVDVLAQRQQTLQRHPVQAAELQYRKMRFTASGITTNRENISWAQVKALTGQANVIAGLGTMTVNYLDAGGKDQTLTVPAECSPAYQAVVALAIAQAQGAEVDQELFQLLETEVAEARSSYLLMGLLLSALLLLLLAVVVLESYSFAILLRMVLIMGGSVVFALAFYQVIIAGTKGVKVTLAKKKIWARGSFSLPLLVVLLGLATTPDSRHWLLGDLNAKLGSFAAAEQHYRQALASSNDNYLIKFDLGEFYLNRGEWEKAFEHLDPAVREHISDWTPEAVLEVPETLLRLGRRDEAIKWCAEVLLDPKIPRDVKRVLSGKAEEIRAGLN